MGQLSSENGSDKSTHRGRALSPKKGPEYNRVRSYKNRKSNLISSSLNLVSKNRIQHRYVPTMHTIGQMSDEKSFRIFRYLSW